MFKKIISNLPFSPALVGQLGFYAKRLRKEKTTRRLALIFVVLALVVQSLAIFQPSTSANATDLKNVNSTGLAEQSPNIIKTEIVTNTSQGFINAAKTVANAGDQISYTISIYNKDSIPLSTSFNDNISDILDYAAVIDRGGGTLDTATGLISWPDITLGPKDTQSRTFVFRLSDPLPATSQGANNSLSFDCTLSNEFGSTTNISVDCPAPKIIEKVTASLPKTGVAENVIFSTIIFIITSYFLLRTRQLEKEIRIIRRNINTGAI